MIFGRDPTVGGMALIRATLIRATLVDASLIRASLIRATLVSALVLTAVFAGALAPVRSLAELSPELLSLLQQKHMPKHSPILVRIFKEEAEL